MMGLQYVINLCEVCIISLLRLHESSSVCIVYWSCMVSVCLPRELRMKTSFDLLAPSPDTQRRVFFKGYTLYHTI
jgi:hypothetical protein